MNNDNHGAGVSSNSRSIQGRGIGSRKNRRSYYYRTNNVGKRSKFNIPSIFPQVTVRGVADSLQRNEFFTAPVDNSDGNLQTISIINPAQYPGWRLYFSTEIFCESSPLANRIKAFEIHIQKYPAVYDLENIRIQRSFNVSAGILLRDDEFGLSWSNFIEDLQVNPYMVLSCLGLGMHSVITTIAVKIWTAGETNSSPDEYKIRKRNIIPSINARPVDFLALSNIADITSGSFDKMFAVHGRVNCITLEETNCTWVVYKCKRCAYEQAVYQKEYPTKPIRCRIPCNSNRNFIEQRSSPFTQIECSQMIQLHEVGMGNLDDSLYIDVEVRRDLVDLLYPGLDITVVGVLKMKHITHQKANRKNYYLQAVSIAKNSLHHEHKDNGIIQMITMEQNCLRLLVQSLAPDICGHEMVKLAVLLSLFGGSGSQLSDEGELNVLLVADPGLGKSKLLKRAASVSQIGKFVSVKVKTNFMPTCPNTSNLIDTGSIMMSQNGHCFIDDMEKLSQNQEVLIHTMQTKSIYSRSCNKIFKILAKSTIIAAVNPAGGHYDSSKLLRENVHLSPSFISLFHLVFIIRDKADKDQDNTLTEHVKALHSGMKQVLSIPSKYSMELKPSNYYALIEELDFDNHLKINSDEQLDLLPAILLKKYIEYARNNIKPLLTKEATIKIKEYYMGLRSEKNEAELFSISTRQLEGLILLTEARARTELCCEATKQHANDIIKLVRLSCTSSLDRLNTNLTESFSGKSSGNKVNKFIKMLQVRCNALGRTCFKFEELKDVASHAGIKCGVVDIIEIVNMQGYLLKKGPDLYELIIDNI